MTGSLGAKLWLALWERTAPRQKGPLGLKLDLSGSTAATHALMAWRPDWKTRAIAAILAARKGTLIDVGANIGQTLLDYRAAAARTSYLGFEPNVVCCQHLARIVSMNRLTDCIIVPAALGDMNGLATLYRYGGEVDSGATTLAGLRPRLKADGQMVPMFRLDDLGDVLPEDEISLIKIDVEGGELGALRGMKETVARTQPWILCEVLHRDVSAEAEPFSRRCRELTDLVGELGYEILRLRQDPSSSSVTALESVAEFPDLAWDDHSSALECDYLLVPKGNHQAAHEALCA